MFLTGFYPLHFRSALAQDGSLLLFIYYFFLNFFNLALTLGFITTVANFLFNFNCLYFFILLSSTQKILQESRIVFKMIFTFFIGIYLITCSAVNWTRSLFSNVPYLLYIKTLWFSHHIPAENHLSRFNLLLCRWQTYQF